MKTFKCTVCNKTKSLDNAQLTKPIGYKQMCGDCYVGDMDKGIKE